jgi:hypothetical protein
LGQEVAQLDLEGTIATTDAIATSVCLGDPHHAIPHVHAHETDALEDGVEPVSGTLSPDTIDHDHPPALMRMDGLSRRGADRVMPRFRSSCGQAGPRFGWDRPPDVKGAPTPAKPLSVLLIGLSHDTFPIPRRRVWGAYIRASQEHFPDRRDPCILGATDAFAHAVTEGDKGYIMEVSGMNLIPFVYLGSKHMVTGYDHLLFLFGVVFFLYRLKNVGLYVSLFAVEHSTTMLLGVYLNWNISSYLIDAIIGLSIVYKALDNLGAYQRWFGFQPNTKAATLIFGLFLAEERRKGPSIRRPVPIREWRTGRGRGTFDGRRSPPSLPRNGGERAIAARRNP